MVKSAPDAGATPSQPRIRVLVARLSEMLRELVSAELDADPELEPLSDPSAGSLADSLARLRPAVLVTGAFDAVDTALLWTAPQLQVFVLADGARAVRHVALSPRTDELGELSLAELVATIKAGQRRDRPDRSGAAT